MYTGAVDNTPNDNLRDLIINVSASLLSIPLVFLLYDYTNNRINDQMKKTLANSVSDKLNTLMLGMIFMLRESMGVRTKLTAENLNRMLVLRAVEISRRLKITPSVLDKLIAFHNDLDTLLYRNSQSSVLEPQQLQILSSIARDMTHLINENKFHHNSTRTSSKYIENIMSRMLDWLDSDSVAALHIQQHLSASDTAQPVKEIKK